MNVVKSGASLQIYGNEIETYSNIPVGYYDICFNKMSGFYLSEREDLLIKEKTIYGNYKDKVDKVFTSFDTVDRNFGIILSGNKGIGKSLFVKILANKAIDKQYPVLVASEFIPGISDFISSIHQTVVDIFDEFEKTYKKTEDGFDPQEMMLSLFDGIDSGKKLFAITCNDIDKINPYFKNRPGRFHYHFKLKNPSLQEIEYYCKDNLKEEYYPLIQKIKGLSYSVPISYDILRALCFELNNGFKLEETLEDLNIEQSSYMDIFVTLKLSNGKVYSGKYQNFSITNDNYYWINLFEEKDRKSRIQLVFIPERAICLTENGLALNPAEVTLNLDEDDYWSEPGTYEKDLEELNNSQIQDIQIEICSKINKFLI